MPYLRTYMDFAGSREIPLVKEETVIGRSAQSADVVLEHPTISRRHAILRLHDSQHVLLDDQSRYGFFVNGEKTEAATLHHGDTIQLGDIVMEYRTDDAVREEWEGRFGKNPALARMRKRFRFLPVAIRVRYRVLGISARELYAAGDTLDVVGGGILLPSLRAVGEGSAIELEITHPGGVKKNIRGEIMMVVPDGPIPLLCVKLHKVSDEEYNFRAASYTRSEWVLAWPRQGGEDTTAQPSCRYRIKPAPEGEA